MIFKKMNIITRCRIEPQDTKPKSAGWARSPPGAGSFLGTAMIHQQSSELER